MLSVQIDGIQIKCIVHTLDTQRRFKSGDCKLIRGSFVVEVLHPLSSADTLQKGIGHLCNDIA